MDRLCARLERAAQNTEWNIWTGRVLSEIRRADPARTETWPVLASLSGEVPAMRWLVQQIRCCNPVPGDDIVGFISRGRGVAVHRADCPNMRNVDPERYIEVSWANQTGTSFNAGIKVIANDQGVILASVSQVVAQLNFAITAINGRIDSKTKQAVVDFNIRLNSRSELDALIDKLTQNKKLIDVYRTSI